MTQDFEALSGQGPRKSGCRIGIDIGGTFTDVILISEDGDIRSRKALSTPDDYGRGVIEALTSLLHECAVPASAVGRAVHATTVATNTILEGKGSKTALVTTRGFRDVLEMRRLRIPEMYTLNFRRPEPMVPRHRRLEVTERMGPQGEIRIALDEDSAVAALEKLRGTDIEALAICLLHSYANPEHERRIADLARRMFGGHLYITCSSEILPEIREYERTSTTVINACLGPVLEHYFASLVSHLGNIGVTAPLQVMKSDGAIMTVASAIRMPAYLVESGPAAGVMGAARCSGTDALADVITLDMGGTTAKASMVEGGKVMTTSDYEVGAGINLSSRLVSGGGYALKLPVVDLSEIGAGGGSLITIDNSGLMHVGPESAGARPGPVSYGLGGTNPTLTDAMIALGYINGSYLVGGELPLDKNAALDALRERVAVPLGSGSLEAAYGVYQIAASTMVRAVKAVSTYRGRDPRDFALFAFGGNGPVVAAEIAGELDMTRIVIPRHPGVFSAFGLLMSDIEHEFPKAVLRQLRNLDLSEIETIYTELETEARGLMGEEGYAVDTVELVRNIDLRYTEQAHELTLPFVGDVQRLAQSFSDEHARTYGHEASAESVESVAVRVKARIPVDSVELRPLSTSAPPPPARGGDTARRAYFGPGLGLLDTPVIDRQGLVGRTVSGPLIIEEYDSTCVVPPQWLASLDRQGNIELRLVRGGMT